MTERDEDERRDRNQRAVAAGVGAAAGIVVAGPAGAIAGAALGPMVEPLVRGVWAELSESARQRQTDVLFWAIHHGVPVDEMEERINASERTQLLTGFALSAATRTAWEDKVRTLVRMPVIEPSPLAEPGEGVREIVGVHRRTDLVPHQPVIRGIPRSPADNRPTALTCGWAAHDTGAHDLLSSRS